MGTAKIKTFLQKANGNPPMLSSIRAVVIKDNTNEKEQYLVAGVNNSDVFVKSVDGNVLVGNYSGSIKDNIASPSYGSIYLWKKDGITYPAACELSIFPKYGLTTSIITALEDLDEYMTNLVSIVGIRPVGDISNLGKCENLQSIELRSTVGAEDCTGNLSSLGKLLSLNTFNFRATSGIWGDVAELADAMVSNGRITGDLIVRGSNKIVYFTYNGSKYRFGDTYDDGGTTKTMYGVKLTFDSAGWSFVEFYNNYE